MVSNEGDRVNVPQEVSYFITIIIDSNTYPFKKKRSLSLVYVTIYFLLGVLIRILRAKSDS